MPSCRVCGEYVPEGVERCPSGGHRQLIDAPIGKPPISPPDAAPQLGKPFTPMFREWDLLPEQPPSPRDVYKNVNHRPLPIQPPQQRAVASSRKSSKSSRSKRSDVIVLTPLRPGMTKEIGHYRCHVFLRLSRNSAKMLPPPSQPNAKFCYYELSYSSGGTVVALAKTTDFWQPPFGGSTYKSQRKFQALLEFARSAGLQCDEKPPTLESLTPAGAEHHHGQTPRR